MEQREVKQVIIIRKDLKMRRGKEITQGAHASTAWLTDGIGHPTDYEPEFHTLWLTEPERAWLAGNTRKITCQVTSETEILELKTAADKLNIKAYVITDAGLTEFNGTPTITAIAIGPDWDDRIDQITGNLNLY